MLENLLYFSPLSVLLFGIVFFMLFPQKNEEHATYYKTARIILLISFVLNIIFYNKPPLPNISSESRFALLFQSIMYVCAFIILYLSRKWFAAMNIAGTYFCGNLFLSVFSAYLLIASSNLYLTAGAMILLMISNYLLLGNNSKKQENSVSRNIYGAISCLCTLFLLVSLYVFQRSGSGLSYESLRSLLAMQPDNPLLYSAAAGILISALFLMNLAPLHFCFTETLGKMILPVFAYFVLVPSVAVIGAFAEININVFAPIYGRLQFFYQAVALISVGIGAIGACSGKNIRKILAYGAVFNIGIIFLLLSDFDFESLHTAFGYMLIYLLSMSGICASLYGLRVKGEYLFMLNEIEGAAQKRPYVCAVLSVFLISLLGLPPSAGFISVFALLNDLAVQRHYYEIIYILLMFLVLSYAFLQIIMTLYFHNSKEAFDRADKGIYIAMTLNVILMLVIMLKPQYFSDYFAYLLESVYE